MVEFGTVGLGAGCHVGEDSITTGLFECVLLQVGGLVAGADAAYPYVMLAMRAMVPLLVSRLTLCDIDFETGFGTLLTVKSKNLKHCIALFQKRTFSECV